VGIAKPEELTGQSVTDYFDFKFDSLPHLALGSEHHKRRVNTLESDLWIRTVLTTFFNIPIPILFQQMPQTLHESCLGESTSRYTLFTGENLS
jgi:hypothetical protein